MGAVPAYNRGRPYEQRQGDLPLAALPVVGNCDVSQSSRELQGASPEQTCQFCSVSWVLAYLVSLHGCRLSARRHLLLIYLSEWYPRVKRFIWKWGNASNVVCVVQVTGSAAAALTTSRSARRASAATPPGTQEWTRRSALLQPPVWQ